MSATISTALGIFARTNVHGIFLALELNEEFTAIHAEGAIMGDGPLRKSEILYRAITHGEELSKPEARANLATCSSLAPAVP